MRMLGTSEYGLYILIGSLVSYLTVLDFGLNNTIVRFVAKHRAESDRSGEASFLATVMLLYVTIAGLAVVVGAVIYMNLDTIFRNSLSPEQLGKAKIMYVMLVFSVAVALPGGAYGAICNGYERFVFPRLTNVVRYLVRSVAVVGVLWLGGRAISIVVIDMVLNVTTIAMNAYYVRTKVEVRLDFKRVDKSLIKGILGYSVWIFLLSVISQFQWQTGQVVLGILSGTKPVAVYGVGVMLGTYYGAFSTAVSSLFLPRATRMVTNFSSDQELTDVMTRIGRLSLIVLLYILGGFVLFGREFIHLWVGEEFRDSWLVALLIMMGYTIPLVQSFANAILEAKAILSFKALLYLAMAIVGTIFGAFLVPRFGPIGMIVGSVSSWMAAQIVLNIYYSKVLNLGIIRFFRDTQRGILISFASITIGFGFIPLPIEMTWVNLLMKGIIYSAAYVFLMFIYAMNSSEKNLVLGQFKNNR